MNLSQISQAIYSLYKISGEYPLDLYDDLVSKVFKEGKVNIEINKENVNQLSLIFFCLVQLKFIDQQKYDEIKQIVFDGIGLLNNQNLINFISSNSLLTVEGESESIAEKITNSQEIILESLQNKSMIQLYIQNHFKMAMNYCYLGLFDKAHETFWKQFMEILYKYQNQIQNSNNNIYSLYQIYVGIQVNKNRDFVYVNILGDCIKEILINQEQKIQKIIHSLHQSDLNDRVQNQLARAINENQIENGNEK